MNEVCDGKKSLNRIVLYIYGAYSTTFNFYFLPAIFILCRSKMHKIDLNSQKIPSQQAWSQCTPVYQRNLNFEY